MIEATYLLALLLLGAATARGQGSDAALRDRVMQLVERLDAPKIEARQAAEEAPGQARPAGAAVPARGDEGDRAPIEAAARADPRRHCRRRRRRPIWARRR